MLFARGDPWRTHSIIRCQRTVDRIYKIGVQGVSDLNRSTFTNLDSVTFPTAMSALNIHLGSLPAKHPSSRGTEASADAALAA